MKSGGAGREKDLKKVDLKVDSLEGLSYSWKVPLKTAEPTRGAVERQRTTPVL